MQNRIHNMRLRKRGGQAMMEYVIAMCAVLCFVVMLAFLLIALKQNGARVLDLIASEYP